MRINYVIVFVSDMKRSVSFYRDLIGLPLRFESPDWTEFVSEGATLALHSSEASIDGRAIRANAQSGSCRPGFSVSDLDEFHVRMLGSNVPCTQEPKNVFGNRIAQYEDPDGLIISVAEECCRS